MPADQPASATSAQQPPTDDPSAGRLRRPSRPLRQPGAPGFGAPAPVSRPLPRETGKLDDSYPLDMPLPPQPSMRDVLSDVPTAQTPAAATGSLTSSQEISEQPTQEYPVTPRNLSAVNGSDNQMPWPQPAGVTLEGRYQIVTIVEASPDISGARNTYRVIDLMGYARCWLCGVEHGSATASERFCPQCGADMIGHEYLMTERRNDGEGATQPATALPADASAPGGTGIATFDLGDRRYTVSVIEAETPLFPWGAHISVAGMSHVGQTRAGDVNEDSFGVLSLNLTHDSRQQPLTIAIVADGLGGHASGQEASRLAVRVFIERLTHDLVAPFATPMGGVLPPDEAVEAALHEAVEAANTAVYEANAQGAADMGATLVAAVVVGDHAWIANVGDSRAYVLDGDALRRITSDHSLVEQLIVTGMIEPEERYTHSQRNRIFRSLGGDPTVEIDIFTQRLKPGMRLMLCSDGLWEMTHDPELEHILRETPGPREACEALITSANAHGGEDNITAIVLRADV